MTAPTASGDGVSRTDHVLLDNRKTPCAVGLIKAADKMRELAPGTVLEIWSRDRFAPMEVPLWAERAGHQVTAQGQAGRRPRRYFTFEVKKGTG